MVHGNELRKTKTKSHERGSKKLGKSKIEKDRSERTGLRRMKTWCRPKIKKKGRRVRGLEGRNTIRSKRRNTRTREWGGAFNSEAASKGRSLDTKGQICGA